MNKISLAKITTAIGLLAAVVSCSDPAPVFHADGKPARLSEWHQLELVGSSWTPNKETEVFYPANQLFTDYAHKMRTLWIPQGTSAVLAGEDLVYPVGTVLTKTFYYPKDETGSLLKVADNTALAIDTKTNQLIETRILVKRDAGWDALPYVWNDEQTDAFLRIAGASKSISLKDAGRETIDFTYFVPNGNQCSGCHVTEHPDGGMHPLGAVAAQLHAKRHESDSALQTENLVAKGWLDEAPEIPATRAWRDETLPIEERASAYLNMQCGHCHNPEGAADTSALILDGSHTLEVNRGICKPPIAAGGGAGNLQYAVVPGAPEKSILLYRMASDKPDEMMPELGRSLVHTEGLELLSKWIGELAGDCG
ncbi:MAG: SO2930 family diheme c-type cytochrome [Pseudohongiellaceae bacterium]